MWNTPKNPQIRAKKVTRTHGKRIWAAVEQIASRLEVPVPDEIIVGLDPQFFVTSDPLLTLEGHTRGQTLYLSLPLCRILTLEEFDSIIAHELSHLSKSKSPLMHGFKQILSVIVPRVPWAPRAPWISWIEPLKSAMKSAMKHALSHKEEIRADLKSARTFGALPLAIALSKLHKFGQVWKSTQELTTIARKHKTRIKNSSRLFQALSKFVDAQTSFHFSPQISLKNSYTHRKSASHPHLHQRLTSLGVSWDQICERDLAPASPVDSAIRLFPNSEELEVLLTKLY